MKKIGLLFATVVMFALFAFSASALEPTGQCGDNVYWNYDIATGELVISGNGAMTDFSYYSPFYDSDIKSVVIEDGVTSIGNRSFYNCRNLTNVTISDSVVKISEGAFCVCSNLEFVTIGNSVVTIAEEAFAYCDSLSNVTIPNSVTIIDTMAFYSCDTLTNMTIGNGVTTIGWGAFSECDSITTITIPDSVTDIDNAVFKDCNELTSIVIGDSVTIIGNEAFKDCNRLTSVTIGESVTTIGDGAFQYCFALESVNIPKTVTTIGDSAFYCCHGLTSVTIPLNVSVIGDSALSNCSNLTDIIVEKNNKYYSNDEYGVLFDKEKMSLIQYPDGNRRTSYTIPDSVVTIKEGAFRSPDNLANIMVDKNNKFYSNDEYGVLFDKEKTKLIQYPYANKRTSYIIPYGVEIIGDYAFYFSFWLTNIMIPDSVTTIGNYSFSQSGFSNIVIPKSVTKIGAHAFYSCNNLASITIPDSITTIEEGSFSFCENLINLSLGNGVIKIGNSAFYACSKLTSVTIPGNVTTIGNLAFDNCINLASVTIGNNVTTIGNQAFRYTSLTNIILPDNITKISGSTFSGCDKLSSVTIGSNVTTISTGAFSGCNSLTEVYYKGSEEDWKNIIIGTSNDRLTNATIYYNFGSKGVLSNGLKWEVSENSLTIRGNATSIPSFERGKAPWSEKANRIEKIYIFSDNVKTIGSYAFYGLNNVEYISIGTDELSQIKKYAFYGIDIGISIWFVGTESEWKNISIDYGNDILKGSDIRCSGTDITIPKEHISTPSKDIDEETFFEEHLKFANDTTLINMLDEYSFHNNVVIKKRILNAYYAWEIIGDVGEALTFKFDDLTINADYYEMYLADMILALNSNEKFGDLDLSVDKYYKDVSRILMDLLKTSDELDEDLDKNFIEEMQEFFSGKNFELSTGAAEKLGKVLKDRYKNNKNTISSIFEGLSTANSVLDIAFKSADVVNAFSNIYNAYVISKAFHDVNRDFFDVCRDASQHLPYKDYQKWFLNAVEEAENSDLGNFDVVFDTTLTLIEEVTVISYETISQNMVQAVVYPVIGKLLGITSGQFNIATLVYNATYGILDACFKHGQAAEAYKTINYITPLEKALQIVVNSRRSDLIHSDKKDNNIALKYDMAYKMLRETNMYLYESAYKYADIKDYKDDLEKATLYKHRWNILRCHYKEYGDEYTMFSAHCPVDVYVYDSRGQLVTSIVNEEIIKYSSNITLMNSGGNKTIAYPSELEYSFVVKARESGTMDYSISKGTATEKLIDYKSYDIPLAKNQEFSVAVPIEDVVEDDYKLNTDEIKVDFDYDYNKSCETHSYGEWLDEGECEIRMCSICGYIQRKAICKHNFSIIKAYSTVPTCTTSGHAINICSDCGITMSDGEYIAALGHEKSKLIEKTEATCTSKGYEVYACDACGDTYVAVEVPANGHTNSEWIVDSDSTCAKEGSKHIECTVCGEAVKTEPIAKLPHDYIPVVTAATCEKGGYITYICVCGDTYTGDKISAKGHEYDEDVCKNCGKSKIDNCSCNCHKSGFMGLIWKILRFFYKLFGTNKVCGCGVAHY